MSAWYEKFKQVDPSYLQPAIETSVFRHPMQGVGVGRLLPSEFWRKLLDGEDFPVGWDERDAKV